MPIVKKNPGASPDLLSMSRLPNGALTIIALFGAAIVILCMAHLNGHLRNLIPDDTGSAIVGVLTGLGLAARCVWIIAERAVFSRPTGKSGN